MSLEEEGLKDIEESVADDDKMDYLVDTDIEKEGNQSETKVADTAVSIEQNEKNKEKTCIFSSTLFCQSQAVEHWKK